MEESNHCQLGDLPINLQPQQKKTKKWSAQNHTLTICLYLYYFYEWKKQLPIYKNL